MHLHLFYNRLVPHGHEYGSPLHVISVDPMTAVESLSAIQSLIVDCEHSFVIPEANVQVI